MEHFVEIKPGRKLLKRIFLSINLWFVGKAIQAAAKVDDEVKQEFDALPDGFTFSLGAFPNGPYMVVGKNEKGVVKYMGSKIDTVRLDMKMSLKSIECLFLLFTFQESTPVANSMDRLYVDGDIPHACSIVRIMDIVQVYLLPKFIAKLAIKRYPKWSLKRHTWNRLMVNLRAIAGF
ncbi:MAG: hypothetical protein GY729_05440 [Desulfobacteraceae bacterium]|nr:hypothetical protein [Desulfobacteraceae bacterium]